MRITVRRIIRRAYSGIDVAKDRICVTVDRELLKWVDDKVEEKIFANRSHAVEYSLKRLKESVK